MGYYLFDFVAEFLAGVFDWPAGWRPAKESRRRGIGVDDDDDTERTSARLPGLSRSRGFGETLRRALTRRQLRK